MKKYWLVAILVVGLGGSVEPATIHETILQGDTAVVRAMLDSSAALIDARSEQGRTPLQTAAYNNKREMVELLLGRGADVNGRSTSGSTPLHGAALAGFDEIVRLLIARGANVNVANSSGYTPLINAAISGNVNVLQMILDAGGDLGAKTTEGQGALLLAAYRGNREVVRKLASAGLAVDERDGSGMNLLHFSALSGDTALLAVGIAGGLAVDGVDTSGRTPLQWAANQCHPDAVSFLLSKGANPNAVNSQGESSLDEGVNGYFREVRPDSVPEVLLLLLHHGATPNPAHESRMTALHQAVYTRNTPIITTLLDAGADPNLAARDGQTAYYAAVAADSREVVKLLIDRGAKVGAVEKGSGNSILHAAVLTGDAALVELIFPSIGDFNPVDKDGRTPMDLAIRYGHHRIARLLETKGAKAVTEQSEAKSAALLKAAVAPGEARLLYLGNCGYAIKTPNHLLIFDFVQGAYSVAEPSPANGHIRPEDLAGENVSVFVTHEHGDHYDSAIYAWHEQVTNLTYVFGFHPEQLPERYRQGYHGQSYRYVGPHMSEAINGMQVRAVRSNDAGVGFVVSVDGLTIFHAGDLAGWLPGAQDGYTSEIDSVAAYAPIIDIAFLNSTGCHVRDTVALEEGALYALDKFSPGLTIPTHGAGREYYYEQFMQKIKAKRPAVAYACPRHAGDVIAYRQRSVGSEARTQ